MEQTRPHFAISDVQEPQGSGFGVHQCAYGPAHQHQGHQLEGSGGEPAVPRFSEPCMGAHTTQPWHGEFWVALGLPETHDPPLYHSTLTPSWEAVKEGSSEALRSVD